MKFLALLPCLITTAIGSPLVQRQSVQMSVSDFAAQTLQNGPGASITFDVAILSGPTTKCSYTDATSASNLPDVSPYIPCEDGRVTWQFRRIISRPGTDGEYLLVVLYSDGGRTSGGFKQWPGGEFPAVTGHNGEVDTMYKGETDFELGSA